MKNIINKYYSKAQFPFIMTIIALLFGLLCIYLMIDVKESNNKILTVCNGLLPFIVFLLITRLTYAYREKKNTKLISNLVTAILSLIFISYFVTYTFTIVTFDAFMNPEVNIKQYRKYVHSERLLRAFPSEIPSDAENPILIYSPGILQAADKYMLYYIKPNINLLDFDNKYGANAKWVGYYNDEEKPLGTDITFGDLPIKYSEEGNFKIYVLESYCDDSGWCNHGNYLLVAVNEKTRQVVHVSMVW